MHVEELLAGPRGRRLCFELAGYPIYAGPVDPAALRASIARCVDTLRAGVDSEAVLFGALCDSVWSARYWQDPDDEDAFLADPEVAQLFEPIAAAVAEHPTTQWWNSALDPSAQVYSIREEAGRPARFDASTADELRRLHAETVDGNERMRQARLDFGEQEWAMTSGTWWSPPIFAALDTARLHPRFGPVGLSLEEDSRAEDEGRSWPLTAPDSPRVFEIDGPAAWAELVARYPIDVTFARGANWLTATGRDDRWAIPDWLAVSADVDAVHLTVAGYLQASGTVIDVGEDTASFIAGWGPDATYWLTDVGVDEERPSAWRRSPELDGRWERDVGSSL